MSCRSLSRAIQGEERSVQTNLDSDPAPTPVARLLGTCSSLLQTGEKSQGLRTTMRLSVPINKASGPGPGPARGLQTLGHCGAVVGLGRARGSAPGLDALPRLLMASRDRCVMHAPPLPSWAPHHWLAWHSHRLDGSSATATPTHPAHRGQKSALCQRASFIFFNGISWVTDFPSPRKERKRKVSC